MDCKEIILGDVIRLDFYKIIECNTSVPYTVSGVVEMQVQQIIGQTSVDLGTSVGQPVFSLAVTGDTDVCMGIPSYSIQSKRGAVGIVYEHTLSAPVDSDFDAAQLAEYTIGISDVMVVLTSYDGTKRCVSSLPKSCEFTYEDKQGNGRSGTIKFTAKSMSALIKLRNVF